MPIDPTWSALIGAAIGGVIGVIGTLISVVAASRRELATFRRTSASEHIRSVREAYALTLNVLFNMNRGGAPDRATLGNVYAQVALAGSVTVRQLVEAYVTALPQEREKIDLQGVIDAMHEHIHSLERGQ